MLPFQRDIHPRCLEILTEHSRCVWRKAEALARGCRYAVAGDYEFLREASLLHDYGMVGVDVLCFFCFGTAPYLCHGVLGARHLREVDGVRYARHARVCEVHIGTGLTSEDVVRGGLPLEVRDYLPETLEEKLITYADNFFSKNPASLCEEKPWARVCESIGRHGEGALERLKVLRGLFEGTC